jgi:hypothetical protein
MPNHIKASWDPCATCGDANGAIDSPKASTPSRYEGEKLFDGMKDEERALWEENGRGQVCSRCRNRFRVRMHRAGRVAKGLTARIRPARLWKGVK